MSEPRFTCDGEWIRFRGLGIAKSQIHAHFIADRLNRLDAAEALIAEMREALEHAAEHNAIKQLTEACDKALELICLHGDPFQGGHQEACAALWAAYKAGASAMGWPIRDKPCGHVAEEASRAD